MIAALSRRGIERRLGESGWIGVGCEDCASSAEDILHDRRVEWAERS